MINTIDNSPVSNRSPFIVIRLENPDLILTRKYEDSEIVIFGFDNNNLKRILENNNLDNVFVPIADIIVSKKNIPTQYKILLVNRLCTASTVPVKFEKLMKIGNGYIWKPLKITYPNIYRPLGLVYSLGIPTNTRLIDASYLMMPDDVFDLFVSEPFVRSNEYGMFVIDYEDRQTVAPQKIQYVNFSLEYEQNGEKTYISVNDNKMKFSELNRSPIKYRDHDKLSLVEGKKMDSLMVGDITLDNADPKEKFESVSDSVRYLPEGRVEQGEKCLEVQPDQKIEKVDCVATEPQLWIFNENNGNIIDRKSGKCLKEDLTKLEECQEKGKFVYPDGPDVKYPHWQQKFGKTLVLTSNDNPWYLNKEITAPIAVREPPNSNTYRPLEGEYAQFPKGEFGSESKDGIIEHFSNEETRGTTTLILMILLIIIAIQIIYLMK